MITIKFDLFIRNKNVYVGFELRNLILNSIIHIKKSYIFLIINNKC